MTGIFRSNNPLNASILFVYGLLLKLPWLLRGHVIPLNNRDGFLYSELIKFLDPAFKVFPVLEIAIVYLLLFTQAMTLNYYANSRRMMARPNYLVAMAYLLATSFFKEWNELSAALIVTSVMIWIWGRLTSLRNDSRVKSTLFNVGFAIGICSFLYLPSLSLVILVLLAVAISRPPKVAEWLLVLLGVFTLWYLLFSYLFLSNKLYRFDLPGFAFKVPEIKWDTILYIGIGLLVFMTLTGAFFVQSESSKQVIQVRKRWTIFLLSIVLLVLMPLLDQNDGLRNWIVSVPAISMFIGAAFFYINSRWIRFILHWGMVTFVLYCQYV